MTMHAFTVFPFTGDVDMTSLPSVIPPGSVSMALNAQFISGGTQENKRYSIRKRNGTTSHSGTGANAISGNPAVTAFADFWRHGASLSPTQKYVCLAGDGIYKADSDSIFDTLLASGFGAATANAYITIAQGYAIFSSDQNQAPRTWDQTTLATLGGSPPNFTGCVYHLQRLWSFGDPASPSRTQYSAAGDIATWSGGDSSNLIFDADDGDRLMGISQPWRNRLYFFKGPHRGSIHELTGATAATFSRNQVLTGAPCVSHGSIVTTTNDIYWASRYGIHSLITTQKYGDTEETLLSRPIQSEWDKVTQGRVDQIRGVHYPPWNIVAWSVPTGSSDDNQKLFVYNYVFGLWSIWERGGLTSGVFGSGATWGRCLGVAKHFSTGAPTLVFGSYGFTNQVRTTRTLLSDIAVVGSLSDTFATNFRVRTPAHLKFGDAATELHEKSFHSLTTFARPTGSYTADTAISIGGRVQASTITLTADGDPIGTFTIGTSAIGSANQLGIIETPIEDRGRSFQAEWRQNGVSQDFEIYGYAVRYTPGEYIPLDGA